MSCAGKEYARTGHKSFSQKRSQHFEDNIIFVLADRVVGLMSVSDPSLDSDTKSRKYTLDLMTHEAKKAD